MPHGGPSKVISSKNCRIVLRQVEFLVSGQGVAYHRWPEGVVFQASGGGVTLQTDCVALGLSAAAHQAKYGQDLGNGWLLLHPIRKLANYQEWMGTNDGRALQAWLRAKRAQCAQNRAYVTHRQLAAHIGVDEEFVASKYDEIREAAGIGKGGKRRTSYVLDPENAEAAAAVLRVLRRR